MRLLLCVVTAALAASGCGSGSSSDGGDGASAETACGANCVDGGVDGSVDRVSTESGADTSSDVRGAWDSSPPDVVVPVGTCTPMGAVLELARENRMRARAASLVTNGTQYAAASVGQFGGVENVYQYRTDAAGSLLGFANVSQDTGAWVEGGALASAGVGDYVAVYASNRSGNAEVYVQDVLSGVAGPTLARVSNDALVSSEAQIVAVTGGYVVAWRSEDVVAATVTLLAAPIAGAGLVVGTPVAVSPVGATLRGFALASDGATAAVAYVGQTAAFTADVYAVGLDANAAPMGTAVPLTAGANATLDVSAVRRGSELVVVWVDVNGAGVLHGRRFAVAAGTAMPTVDLAQAGSTVRGLSLATDGANLVAAYRTTDAMGAGRVGVLRLDPVLGIRDGVSTVASALDYGGRIGVASQGGTAMAVAWADANATESVVRMQIMGCP